MKIWKYENVKIQKYKIYGFILDSNVSKKLFQNFQLYLFLQSKVHIPLLLNGILSHARQLMFTKSHTCSVRIRVYNSVIIPLIFQIFVQF